MGERGISVRNAVVASPARTTGCETSQRRNGRFVVTPSTSVFCERSGEKRQSFVAVAPVRDELRDQRVVGEPDLVALLDPGVDSNAARAL